MGEATSFIVPMCALPQAGARRLTMNQYVDPCGRIDGAYCVALTIVRDILWLAGGGRQGGHNI